MRHHLGEFRECGHLQIVKHGLVPDEAADIELFVKLWSDGPSPVHLLLTTGGTGFAVRVSFNRLEMHALLC